MADLTHNYNFPHDYSRFRKALDGQVPHVDLVVAVRMQYSAGWPNRYLTANLTGSRVSADGVHNPPEMAYNGRDKRGWFTESVLVSMWLSDGSNAWKKNRPAHVAPEIFRKNDGPVTTGGSVTQTSGTSESLGANAGAMGGAPMVGISGGISMSQSFSESIPNFSIANNSNETLISQLFHMTSSDGGRYSHGGDLVYRKSPFDQTSLHGIPDKAIAGLEINSQAIWAAPADYEKTVQLNVRLVHTLTKVWSTKSGIGRLDSHTHTQCRGYPFERSMEVKFSDLGT